MDISTLHGIVGRFGGLVDFDAGGTKMPGVVPGVTWLLRAQFYARESAQLCINTLDGHILDPAMPVKVVCIFDATDLRAGHSIVSPPPVEAENPR
eukprot:4125760-Lingulodinium_polyedra.AAC.1